MARIATLKVVDQWVGRFRGVTEAGRASDKTWAAGVTARGVFVARWGKTGSPLIELRKDFGSQELALDYFDRMVAAKRQRGYTKVRGGDINALEVAGVAVQEREHARAEVGRQRSIATRQQKVVDLGGYSPRYYAWLVRTGQISA